MVAALNKAALDPSPVASLAAGVGSESMVANQGWCSGDAGLEVAFVLGLRRRIDACSDVDVESRSLYRSASFVGSVARSLKSSSLSTASSLLTKKMDQDRRLSNPLRVRRAIRKNEDDDFPSAMKLQIVKAWPTREECGGSGGAARPRLAAATVVCWFLRDWNVIFLFLEVCCTAGLC